MASIRQLRDIFAPILAEHPDLVLHGRWLFRPPIETALVGLFIDRTSSARSSRMLMSVVPLSRFCTPSVLGHYDGFEVERVIGVPPPGRWIPGEPEGPPRIFQDMFAPDYQGHLRRNFNAKVPQFLDAVRTFEEVVAWIEPFRDWPLRMGPPESIDGWIAAMQGNFKTAADQLETLQARMMTSPGWTETDTYQDDQASIDVLRTGDPAAIAVYLHAREERTIAAYRLQRFWRRTPFPFERG
jgi:hypothetical protein